MGEEMNSLFVNVDENGVIAGIQDPLTGESLPYKVVGLSAKNESLPSPRGGEKKACLPIERLDEPRQVYDNEAPKDVVYRLKHDVGFDFMSAFATQSARLRGLDRMFPEGVAYALDAKASPNSDVFPLDLVMGSGISLFEIRLPAGEGALATTWFTEERTRAARDLLRRAGGAAIGLSNDPEFLLFLRDYTDPSLQSDPFLCPLRDGDFEAWDPGLNDYDRVDIMVSTLTTTDDRVLERLQHDRTQPSRFFVVSRARLDDELIDQARHFVRWRASLGDTWADIAACPELRRVVSLGRAKRAMLIRKVCEAFELAFDEGEVVSCDSDAFCTTEMNEHPIFYSGASCTTENKRGSLSIVGDDDAPNLLWFHGPYSGKLGGGSWRMDDSYNAMPIRFADMEDDTIAGVVAAGFDVVNGFAELFHVVKVC